MNSILKPPYITYLRWRDLIDPAKFPTLARAAENEYTPTNPKIEWVVGDETWTNYCSIFRVPYRDGDHAKHRDEFLGYIEEALVDGVPHREGHILMVGGYRHYLGRDLVDGDEIALASLRGPQRRVIDQDQWGVYYDDPIHEFLAEVSLRVIPA